MLKDDMIDLHFGGRAFERDRGTVQGGSSKQSNRTLRYFEKPLFKYHDEPPLSNSGLGSIDLNPNSV
jgi:hypothetical protein